MFYVQYVWKDLVQFKHGSAVRDLAHVGLLCRSGHNAMWNLLWFCSALWGIWYWHHPSACLAAHSLLWKPLLSVSNQGKHARMPALIPSNDRTKRCSDWERRLKVTRWNCKEVNSWPHAHMHTHNLTYPNLSSFFLSFSLCLSPSPPHVSLLHIPHTCPATHSYIHTSTIRGLERSQGCSSSGVKLLTSTGRDKERREAGRRWEQRRRSREGEEEGTYRQKMSESKEDQFIKGVTKRKARREEEREREREWCKDVENVGMLVLIQRVNVAITDG